MHVVQIDPRGLQGILGLARDGQPGHGGQGGQSEPFKKQGQTDEQRYHCEYVQVYLKYVAVLYFYNLTKLFFN